MSSEIPDAAELRIAQYKDAALNLEAASLGARFVCIVSAASLAYGALKGYPLGLGSLEGGARLAAGLGGIICGRRIANNFDQYVDQYEQTAKALEDSLYQEVEHNSER